MLLVCVNAHGADDVTEKAAEHFRKGVALFKENRKEEAVKEFKTAYQLKPAWKIKYNIGQCEASLRRYGLAIEAFERYLGEGGDEVSEDRRDEVIKELDRLRKMVGSVRVQGPDGYDVMIDGIKRGDTSMASSILVTAGIDHLISVEKDGEVIFTATETVSGGEILELTAVAPQPPGEETPVVPAAPVDDTGSDNGTAAEADGPNSAETATEPEKRSPMTAEKKTPPPEPRSKPFSPIVLIVGASTAVVFGGVAGGMAVAINAKWEQSEKKIDENPWGTKPDAVAYNIRTMQIVGWAALGLSGAGLILTAVAIPLTDWRGKRKRATTSETSLRISPFGAPSGGGLSFSGRF